MILENFKNTNYYFFYKYLFSSESVDLKTSTSFKKTIKDIDITLTNLFGKDLKFFGLEQGEFNLYVSKNLLRFHKQILGYLSEEIKNRKNKSEKIVLCGIKDLVYQAKDAECQNDNYGYVSFVSKPLSNEEKRAIFTIEQQSKNDVTFKYQPSKFQLSK